MLKLVKSPNLSNCLKVSKQVIGSVSGEVAEPFSVPKESVKIPDSPQRLNDFSLAANAPKRQLLAQAGGFGGKISVFIYLKYSLCTLYFF